MHLSMCFAMFCFSSRLECCAGSAHGFTLLSRCPPRPPRPPRHQAACRMQCLITSARTLKMWRAKMLRSNWWPMTGHRLNLWHQLVRSWSKRSWDTKRRSTRQGLSQCWRPSYPWPDATIWHVTELRTWQATWRMWRMWSWKVGWAPWDMRERRRCS